MLEAIVDCVDVTSYDVVLEVGPGLGTLTSVLLARASAVLAVEYDEELARKLPGQFPGKNLEVVRADFLNFDLTKLSPGYKVVANIPYYITAKIIQKLIRAENRPAEIALLVQREVAEKLCANAGELTPLAIEIQIDYDVHLGIRVPKMYFTPPPKVDSRVLVMKSRKEPLITESDKKAFFRLVQAAFSAPRKKLRSSLAGGLGVDKEVAEEILACANVDSSLRAQDLSLDDWQRLAIIDR